MGGSAPIAYITTSCGKGRYSEETDADTQRSMTMSDECEECRLYGDDYRWDVEEQGYVSNCEDCVFNEYRGEYDNE